ncbi:MAG: hypothetical protein U0527_02745 [Candidatus Eisenbacteria bacterium]
MSARSEAEAQGTVVTNLSLDPRRGGLRQSSGPSTPVGEAHVVAAMKANRALIGGEGTGE